MNDQKLILGAVCYAPKVVEIWEGFKSFFVSQGLPFDFVLYSNYETQVEALFDKNIDLAWNSPLAWIRAKRISEAEGIPIQAISMRDTDCDLSSVIIVKQDSVVTELSQLKGIKIAVGAVDSPQATLIPLQSLKELRLIAGNDFTVDYNNVLCGKHGDHVGGEENAVRKLMAGTVDAACLIEGNIHTFIQSGLLSEGSYRIIHKTQNYDHCNFTALTNNKKELLEKFNSILLQMDYNNPQIKYLLDLEGLKKWCIGRTSHYEVLEKAVDSFGFYSKSGEILDKNYVY